MAEQKKILPSHDVKLRYLSGGVWKRRLLEKEGKGRSEHGSMAREKCTALCAIHDIEMRKNCPKYVKVGYPRGKKERFNGGCPICKAEEVQQ